MAISFDKLIKNFEDTISKNTINEKEIYSNKFITKNTTLKSYNEFRKKFNIKDTEFINEVDINLKNKVVKTISKCKNWKEFEELANSFSSDSLLFN